MAIPVVTYKVRREGPTYEEINEVLVDQFVFAVLHDQQSTPDQFEGTGRRGRTPFNRSGALIKGLFFKRAGNAARKAGRIGTIRAPAARFKSGQVRNKFMDRVQLLWSQRGVGWSLLGPAFAQKESMAGMTAAQRDLFLAGKGR